MIAAYATDRLAFSSAAGSCTLEPLAQLVDRHTDGAYAVVRFLATCPDGTPAGPLRYGALFDIDPLHRGTVAFTAAAPVTSAVLSPAEPELAILDRPPGGRGFVPFFRLGVQPIALGFDHLLFLLVVLLPAGHRPAEPQRPAILGAGAD